MLLSQQTLDFQRYLLKEINWENRLVGILGSRGAGKTTLLLQRMKMLDSGPDECLYVSLDDVYFSAHSLIDTAEAFRKTGGKYLFLDEVHKYPGWAREVKNIYDFYRDIRLVFTGSSIIELLALDADLSRRARKYMLNGLSFREFLEFDQGVKISATDLSGILTEHISIASSLNEIKPVRAFKNYLEHGYYPFFKEDLATYGLQLASVVRLIIEYDLAFIEGIDKQQIRKIYHLLTILAKQVPFTPNVTELAKVLGMGRGTLIQYLHFLEKAKLIQALYLEGKGLGPLEKPGKLLLDNPNLFEALSAAPRDEGSRRECFFVNQLRSAGHLVHLAKRGDFKVNEKYTFEVGGPGKDFKQISDVKDSFVARDEIEIGTVNKIPLWLFGLLY